MNDETKAIIDRARALLSEATPGPWEVWQDGTAAWINMGDERRVVWLGHIRGDRNRRDARLMAAAPDMFATFCDALQAAERRAEEAEAGAAVLRDALMKYENVRANAATVAAGMVALYANRGAGRALLDRLHAAEAEVARLKAQEPSNGR